jgi:hypothetical protein
VPGKDPTDHDVLHPGLWLAFADVSGQDSWRNLGAIKHERFTEPPAVREGRLTFATESRLQTTNGQPLGTLLSRITLSAPPAGYLLVWEAAFAATEQDIVFGDQEEMGLGIRVATPITEKNGGLIRDYGLMVANPFGRKSMNQGELSRVEVKQGERLRLRFGILLHSAAPEVFHGTVFLVSPLRFTAEEAEQYLCWWEHGCTIMRPYGGPEMCVAHRLMAKMARSYGAGC